MLASDIELQPGMPITSPGGRRLEVGDVFVPRHEVTKSRSLPPSFRNVARKVVVFRDGSIAPLAEVRQRFHVVVQPELAVKTPINIQGSVPVPTNSHNVVIQSHGRSRAREL